MILKPNFKIEKRHAVALNAVFKLHMLYIYENKYKYHKYFYPVVLQMHEQKQTLFISLQTSSQKKRIYLTF